MNYEKAYKEFWETDIIKCGNCGKLRTDKSGGWVKNGNLIFWFCCEKCYNNAIKKLY